MHAQQAAPRPDVQRALRYRRRDFLIEHADGARLIIIVAGRDERMMMKLVVDGDSQRVVGCHLVGPAASEIAQMAAIPIKMGAVKADFDRTVSLHPTIAEELVTMRKPVSRTGTA